MEATTAGTGQLILRAVSLGARQVVVGCGGSATTDGGAGALGVIGSVAALQGVDLVAACDVTTGFLDAAGVFGPQKGATPEQVELLTDRLGRLATRYRDEFGVEVTQLPGVGAAGGLAGGLAALGARITSGFELVAEFVDLDSQLAAADLVMTGEGYLDRQSFSGKVVGGVIDHVAGRVPISVLSATLPPIATGPTRPPSTSSASSHASGSTSPIGGARAHRGSRRRACLGTELTRTAEGSVDLNACADPDSKSGDVIEEPGVRLRDAARVADLDPGHGGPDGGEGHGDAVVPVGVDRGRRAMEHPRVRSDRRASPPPPPLNGAVQSRRLGSDRSRARGRSPRRGSSCPREPVLPGPRPSEAGPAWLPGRRDAREIARSLDPRPTRAA